MSSKAVRPEAVRAESRAAACACVRACVRACGGAATRGRRADAALLVAVARDDHHPRAAALALFCRLAHAGPQQRRERKVAQVIDRVVPLEAVFGERALRDGHHTCVQHQDVHRPVAPPLGKSLDRSEIAEVAGKHLDRAFDLRGRFIALGWVSDSKHYLGSHLGQAICRGKAQPAVRTRLWKRVRRVF